MLTDSSKIGFCGALYAIISKITPLGTKYKLGLENLIDKIFSGSALNHHIAKKEWAAAVVSLHKFEQPVRSSVYSILLSDCRSLSFARRMKDTSLILFHDACFLSSFVNLSHRFIPGNYVGISDSITRHFANIEVLKSFPVRCLPSTMSGLFSLPQLW